MHCRCCFSHRTSRYQCSMLLLLSHLIYTRSSNDFTRVHCVWRSHCSNRRDHTRTVCYYENSVNDPVTLDKHPEDAFQILRKDPRENQRFIAVAAKRKLRKRFKEKAFGIFEKFSIRAFRRSISRLSLMDRGPSITTIDTGRTNEIWPQSSTSGRESPIAARLSWWKVWRVYGFAEFNEIQNVPKNITRRRKFVARTFFYGLPSMSTAVAHTNTRTTRRGKKKTLIVNEI